MAAISDLFPLVAPYAPAVPNPTMAIALRTAAIRLCERAGIWKQRLTTEIGVGACHELYDPGFAAIHRIERAWLNDQPLKPLRFADISPTEHERDGTGNGSACGFTQIDPSSISIYPNEAGTLSVDVILKPALMGGAFDADTPDIFIHQHGQTLAYGALARILAMPGQSWSNPNEANRYMMMFEEATDRALNANFRGQHGARPRIRAFFL